MLLVSWPPPPSAMQALSNAIASPDESKYFHRYSFSVFGEEAVRSVFLQKVENKNNLKNKNICITQGANQGFMNLVMSLLDAGDKAMLFQPYYFNHQMALQIGSIQIVTVPVQEDTLLPLFETIQETLEEHKLSGKPIKMVNKTTFFVL